MKNEAAGEGPRSSTPGKIYQWENCKKKRKINTAFLVDEDGVVTCSLFFFFHYRQESRTTGRDGDGENAKTEQKQETKGIEEIRMREQKRGEQREDKV